MKDFAAIVLAAGSSRRMGKSKLLLDVGGEPMVRRAVTLCQAAGFSSIIAVLGHDAAQLAHALSGVAVQCVHNDHYAQGMSSSLQAGLTALPAGTQAALIYLADMPLVTVDDITALCAAYAPAQNRIICVPVHGGRRGNPVLLGQPVFSALSTLSGDQGAKSFIQAHTHLVAEVSAGPGVLIDLDTPAAYAAFAADTAGMNIPGSTPP